MITNDETNGNNDPNTSITGSTYNVPRRITGADGNPVNNLNYDKKRVAK